MAIVRSRPTTAGRRHHSSVSTTALSKDKPLKSLLRKKKKITGRNNTGKITIRHRGGGQKRKLRVIDFSRDKRNIPGTIKTIEYDPNRGAHIALVVYADGEKRYMLAPEGLVLGRTVISGEGVEVEVGNALPLRDVPLGAPIHNIELRPGKGGQLCRGAGVAALVQSKEGAYATVLLPSKELRLIHLDCYATIGQVSNQEKKTISLGKAGRKRHMGWRPAVRGVAMSPDAHPHGGGEGRSGIGMPSPKSPWGKKTLGKKTRSTRKYSNSSIVRDRRSK